MTRYIKNKYPNGLKIIEQSIHNTDSMEHQHKTKYEIQRDKALENKKQRIAEVKDLFSKGYNKSQISRITGLDRRTVKSYIEMQEPPMPQKRIRDNIATPYMATIEKLVSEGLKPKAIYQKIAQEGYKGSERFVRYIITEHCGIRKPRIKAVQSKIDKINLTMILWKKEDTFTDNQRKQHEEHIKSNPELEHLRNLVQKFRKAIDEKDPYLLLEWIDLVESEKNRCFYEVAINMKSDIQAIKNSLIYPYSNGPLEGNINRLKAIKRQMYGRAKFDLLKKKVLYRPA
jgi:transposase